MSSTRTAKDDSIYHQHSYASSAEFERGLLGNLVAKRVALLDQRVDRELIWAVHFLSHQEGGLEKVAVELLANFSQNIGTSEMAAIGKRGKQVYTSAELSQVAGKFPKCCAKELLKQSGSDRESEKILMHKRQELTRLQQQVELGDYDRDTLKEIEAVKRDMANLQRSMGSMRDSAISHRADDLQQLCMKAANGTLNSAAQDIYPLTKALADLCLKASRNLEPAVPWYFAGMVPALRDYISGWSGGRSSFPETSLGKIVAEEFDYTWQSRCLSLLHGESRRGKTFAARNCCLKNIGHARYVEVPPGNDDTSFFRSLARGLGLGNFLKYKAIDIRERVESTLLSGDLLLVLDEAQRLWPECWQRYAKPARINWLMTMVNARVPILLISTPQFLTGQRIAEKTGWNSSQFTGRIYNHKILPDKLEEADLLAISRHMLPECEDGILKQLCNYALISDRCLSAIESVAMRARYLASRDGRPECGAKDVHQALKENIIPSDNLLSKALETSRAETSRRKLPRPDLQPEETLQPINRVAQFRGKETYV